MIDILNNLGLFLMLLWGIMFWKMIGEIDYEYFKRGIKNDNNT